MRLVCSGVMERYPNLTIIMSHTGGALPYKSGRMDKNGTAAKLASKPSTYIEDKWTDELAQVNDPRGKPGITGNKQALEIISGGCIPTRFHPTARG